MASNEIIVRFVKNSEDVKVVKLMEKAFLAVQDVCATSIWFNEEDCLTLSKCDKYIFVFGSFTGDGFEKVVLLGNRIYGAPCILQCLESREALPKKQHPVFSLSMKDVVVTCTNLSTDSRRKIHQKVEWMMGEASKVMNEKVNYLVAGGVGSKKYLVAGARGNKIMLDEWIHALWSDACHEMVHCSDSKYDKFKCPIFKGFSMCASGLSVQERLQIKNDVELEGARFSGDMLFNECTHLIIREPCGQKYEAAKKWNVFTIKPEWIYESLEVGYCLEESKYALLDNKPSRTTSTPKMTGQEYDVSILQNISSISITHINETDNMSSTFSARNLATQKQTKKLLPIFNSIDLRHAPSDNYLNGCKIYLYGSSLENSDKVRILINKGNGMRFSQLNEISSHVIAENVDETLTQQLSKLNKKPHVVSLMWLVESFKNGRCLPEEDFLLIQNQSKNETSVSLVKNSKPHIMRPNLENIDVEIASLYSQNVSAAKCNEFSDQTMMAAMQMMEESKNSMWNRETFGVEQGITDFDDEEDKTIFSGLTFYIFHREFMEELTKDIEAFGGKVLPLNSRKVAKIGIVPIEGCPVTRTVDEVVTTAWVNMCIEESKFLPFDFVEIFRPMTILPNCQPLKECVFSISGIQGLEKNVIMDILQLLGGRVQDCFVRVGKENFEACTHLVADVPEGQKFEAAMKWGIPAISKSWVYECARTGKKVPEKNFQQIKRGLDNDRERAAKSSACGVVKVTSTPKNQSPLKYNASITSKKQDNKRSVEAITPAVLPWGEAKVTSLTSEVAIRTPLMQSENRVQQRGSMKVTRVQALVGSKKTPDDDVTPSKFMDGKPFKPKFNFENILDGMPSPIVTVKPCSRKSLSLEDVFAENINMAVMRLGSNEWKDDSSSQEEDFEGERSPLLGSPQNLTKTHVKSLLDSPQNISDVPISTPVENQQLEDDPMKNNFLHGLKKLTKVSRSSLRGKPRSVPDISSTMTPQNDDKDDTKEKDMSNRSLLKRTVPPGSQCEVTWECRSEKDQSKVDDVIEMKRPRTSTRKSKSSTKSVDMHGDLGGNQVPKDKQILTFMLTGFKVEERMECTSLIESLGASVVDELSSHLISNNALRSEKFLACISTGKWVLHKSYLTACKAAGHFVEEENYEWGSQNILRISPDLTEQEKTTALTSRTWRLELQNQNKGAFYGWICLVMTCTKKIEGIKKLLMTGGATIISNEDNWESQGVTHAFLEPKNVTLPKDLSKMVAKGIHCLKPEFIVHSLTDQVDIKDYYIPEVQKMLRENSNERK